jgi:hypothetical protein
MSSISGSRRLAKFVVEYGLCGKPFPAPAPSHQMDTDIDSPEKYLFLDFSGDGGIL